jgi:hypothetical protein
MFGRRLIILVAVLMGLTALAASVAPPPRTERGGRAAAPTPSPTATAAPPAPSGPSSRTVTARIDVDAVPSAPVRARVGDTVVLDVSGDVVGAVVVSGLPAIEPINPDTPAHLELFADAPGRFPIRLLDQRRDVGILDVAARD